MNLQIHFQNKSHMIVISLKKATMFLIEIPAYFLYYCLPEKQGKTGLNKSLKNHAHSDRSRNIIVLHRLRIKYVIIIAKTIVRKLPFFKGTNLCMFHVENSRIYHQPSILNFDTFFFLPSSKEEDKIQ